MPDEPKKPNRFLLALMCFIQERGGFTTMPSATAQELMDSIKKFPNECYSVGFQPLPGGILLVNLIGNDAIAAWDAGQLPEVKEEKDESGDSSK